MAKNEVSLDHAGEFSAKLMVGNEKVSRGPGKPANSLRFRHDDFAIEETIARADFNHWIAPDIARISATVDVALVQAGLKEDGIDRVFLTGGTSLVPAVRGLFEVRFGTDLVTGGGEFVSVAEGLALIGNDRQGLSAA